MLTKKIIFPIVVLCHILVLGCNKDQLEGSTLDVYENSIASVTRYVDSVVSASRGKGESQKNPGESILRYVDKSSMRVVQYLGKSFVLGDVLDDFGGKTKVNLKMSRKILFLPSSGGFANKIIECYTSDISDMEIVSYSAKKSKGRSSAPNSKALNQKMIVYNQNYLMMHGIGEVKRTILGSSKSSRKANITSVSDGSFNNSFNGSSDCQTWGAFLLERDWDTGEILSSTLLYTYTVGDCTRMNEDTAIPIQGGGSGGSYGGDSESDMTVDEMLYLYEQETASTTPIWRFTIVGNPGFNSVTKEWSIVRGSTWEVKAITNIKFNRTLIMDQYGYEKGLNEVTGHSTASSFSGTTLFSTIEWGQTGQAIEDVYNNGSLNTRLVSRIYGTLTKKPGGRLADIIPGLATYEAVSNSAEFSLK
jgi:hypothetical protein